MRSMSSIKTFYARRNVDCLVLAGRTCVLVTLCADNKTHEFRYVTKTFAGAGGARSLSCVLEREYAELLAASSPLPPGRYLARAGQESFSVLRQV